MNQETTKTACTVWRTEAVTGHTRMFGILADPIYHVKTPEAMNALFAARGMNSLLVPIHVKSQKLATVVAGLRTQDNFGGFIATVPHKAAMLDLCDEVSREARFIGAVNCVRCENDGRLVGAMLDGIGFVKAIRSKGVELFGLRVFLVGAGGASSAIAFSLAEAGVSHITISNRTAERANALKDHLLDCYPGTVVKVNADRLDECDLVVNGSTLGMHPADVLPVEVSRLKKSHLVADAIMEPKMTPLLLAANARGCAIFPGKPMLDFQIMLMAKHMNALCKEDL